MNGLGWAAATYLYFIGAFLTLHWPGLEDRVTRGERILAALLWPFSSAIFLAGRKRRRR